MDQADLLESSAKGYRPWGPRHGEDDDGALGRHDWWNDANVISMDDPEALGHFLSKCDYLMEASNSGWEAERSYLGTQGISRDFETQGWMCHEAKDA